MKKLLLFFFAIVLPIPNGWAQTGFQDKSKPADSGTLPTFDFQEVPIPKSNPSKNPGLQAQNNTPSLRTALRFKVIRDADGSVIWLEDRRPSGQTIDPQSRQNANSPAFQFLEKVKGLLGVAHPTEAFELLEATTDELNQTHLRMRQVHRGVPVYGGEIMLHTQNDKLVLLNGRSFPEPTLTEVRPTIDQAEASELAMKHLGKKAIVRPTDGLTARFGRSQHELVIYHPAGRADDPRLTWHLTLHPNVIERWEYFVDARTGEILHAYNHTCGLDGPVTARNRDLNGVERAISTYRVGSGLYLIDATRDMFNRTTSKMPDDPVGALWTIDADNTTGDNFKVKHVTSTNGTNWNATAVSAHYNAGIAFDYFSKTFRRNSLNGKGGTVISVVNMADPDDGKGFDNAFWNGEYMAYGNGRNAFKPLAGALDVAGHEMTHGVIQNTANLEYQDQSGAVSESIADVFGVLIDRDDWTLAEDVVQKQYFPSGAMRSMSNPNQGGKGQRGYQPMTMAQYDPTTEDNGGVHINSGIPNYAFYLIASKIGKEKAEAVYYRTLTTYLTRRSQFLDLRLAVIQATTDLYGANGTETATAKQAFDTVGITEGQTNQSPKTEELPVNPGQDAILVYSLSNSTLYLTTPQVTNFNPVASQGTKHKPSVTDDGKLAYYVSSDSRIMAVPLTGSGQAYVVASDPIWANVAISRDGRKLAALMADADKSIWVYSFDRKEWKRFRLYNPTYTQGITTGEVKYADSFQWDAAGEKLVYDAFNEIKNLGGSPLQYWDMGLIRVWNKGANNFGDGNIEKLFTNLDEGENIGNPSFAKNSPHILAFDYYDDIDDSYYVLGTDIDKGDLKAIYQNNTLGFPDYSRTDEQLVFNTLASSKENVAILNLNKDRISPNGSPRVLVQNGKWATWFAQGARQTPTKQSQSINFAISDRVIGDAPFDLAASATSGLPVRFERLSGGVTLQGQTVSITQAGKATIRATQEGNNQYLPAAVVERTFCVNPTRPTVRQDGLNLTASAKGADSYIWYDNGVAATNVSSAAVSVDRSGQYAVRAVTSDGCQSELSAIVQVVILANDPVPAQTLTFYPNPVRDELTIEGDLQHFSGKVSVSDVSGNVTTLDSRQFSAERWRLDTRQLGSGIYILNLEKEGRKVTYKILKE